MTQRSMTLLCCPDALALNAKLCDSSTDSAVGSQAAENLCGALGFLLLNYVQDAHFSFHRLCGNPLF